ncbi:hypothetical protein HPP92_023317 [Vanilla planifolia]|uniref:Uncharacterized protein n=1 Tax=Vanilla planifolia TaxID=51239 RepID=A0A835PT44_VANPL|nr:hypothetical protein HPP92_023317 [Vanilla planifolia]
MKYPNRVLEADSGGLGNMKTASARPQPHDLDWKEKEKKGSVAAQWQFDTVRQGYSRNL